MKTDIDKMEDAVNPGVIAMANKFDEKMKLDEKAKLEKAKELRDYRRDLAKFNAYAIRTAEKMPTKDDIARLEYCMHAFKK